VALIPFVESKSCDDTSFETLHLFLKIKVLRRPVEATAKLHVFCAAAKVRFKEAGYRSFGQNLSIASRFVFKHLLNWQTELFGEAKCQR
jgi:hypothetical protein